MKKKQFESIEDDRNTLVVASPDAEDGADIMPSGNAAEDGSDILASGNDAEGTETIPSGSDEADIQSSCNGAEGGSDILASGNAVEVTETIPSRSDDEGSVVTSSVNEYTSAKNAKSVSEYTSAKSAKSVSEYTSAKSAKSVGEYTSTKATKSASKPLYALLSILTPILGTLTGVTAAVTMGVGRFEDASSLSPEVLEEIEQWGGWVAEFSGKHAQENFCGKWLLISVILALLTLAAVIGLAVMSGRFTTDEDGKQALNRFDRIWSEIHITVLACASVGAIFIAAPIATMIRYSNHFGLIDLRNVYTPLGPDAYYYGLSNNWTFWYCVAGMAACIYAASVCFVTIVKKLKAGKLIKCSLLGRILEFLGWGAKQTGHGAVIAGARLKDAAGRARRLTIPGDTDRYAVIKIILKYSLLAAGLILAPVFFLALWGWELVMRGWELVTLILPFAMVVCAVVIIRRKVYKLCEIRTGVIEVKSGNLSYKIPVEEDENGPKTDLDKLAQDINRISEATNAAVQNEIKNQRLKTDLISNVSHDLKTPLTSMISYLDILEKEGLDSEDAPAHLAIVREKTDRLRVLTEELFEAAKASSGNIPCEIETIDLSALIDQSLAEMEDRLSKSELDVRKNIRTDSTLVKADGKLLYRVLENLLSNISKYALEKSRVYIDVSQPDAYGVGDAGNPGKVLLEVKNISRDELNISPDELMERFTRGDQSRNTEGSGLGLAIAKDLTTLMGGSFDITIDGDMFKVSVLLNKA